jgi:Fur family ferric uptake transcriptional regulator
MVRNSAFGEWSMDSKNGRRMTKQRKIILEELKKVTSHPTADQLHQMVRKRLPNISIATIYRNLETLSDDGLILKMDVAGTQRRFDGNPENHYHIRCCKCGRVDDVHMDRVASIEADARRACGYAVLSHRIEFTGICPECDPGD